ncbi:hypothetical protein COT97_04495 [Candidatus Falkowbacteria bacterium CG10_big_fil_rev_8_21_14_0_10_39_11]|uniref:Uncharacterized protein n=1 Tax=Candidatus Falkowbacteria bacterium CG10_big_fil_rev_8_21_14_0_10_39_11 TaxID=1974565 RepID=A0A2H0V416_9BACT|nr:MAG: hypothetical protein COT97_04495 [Candidatus Falkowbacteria bacterium CG10_big_fil_rev_8_21_14_0_10_39_11]
MRHMGQFFFDGGDQYIVVHTQPDQDCMIPKYLYHYMFDLKVTDPRIHVRFVIPGERYTLQPGESGFVWHMDTGRDFILSRGNCDHHSNRDYVLYPNLTDGRVISERTEVKMPFPFDSTAHIMYELGIKGTDKDTPAIRALIHFNRHADTGGRYGRLPQVVFDDVDVANACLAPVVNGLGRFMVENHGPSFFGKLFKSFPSHMSDNEKMLFSHFYIDAFVKSYKDEPVDGLAELRPLISDQVDDCLPESLAVDCDSNEVDTVGERVDILNGFGFYDRSESVVAKSYADCCLKDDFEFCHDVMIVLPEIPSLSECFSVALIKRIAEKYPHLRFHYRFMVENEDGSFDAYDEEVSDGNLVIQLNVGGIFDPANFNFDESAADFPYRSLAEALYDWFFIPHFTPVFIKNSIKWITFHSQMIQGAITPRLSQQRFAQVEDLYRQLVNLHGPMVMFALNHYAPVYMEPAYESMLQSVTDGGNHLLDDRIFTELTVRMIIYYFDDMTLMSQIKGFIKEQHRSFISDDINVLIVPASSFETKRIRQIANRRPYNNNFDVMVVEYQNQTDDTRFGITILNNGKIYQGTQAIYDEIHRRDPSLQRSFMHPEHFVIYLKDETILSLDDLVQITVENLRFKEYREGQAPFGVDVAEAA